jgi:histidine triad (HIT) family protein
MNEIGDCVFCNLKLNKGEIIFETENFFVNIGLGLAAPGHVMLIPKKHFACCADISEDLRPEFENLRSLIFEKIKDAFGTPFLVEYGIFGQSVFHAHLHFIPKSRKATEFYPAYEIKDIFREMQIPDGIPVRPALWKTAVAMKNKNGGYVFLQDGGRAVLFGRFEKELSYRHFFSENPGVKDVPARWQDITAEQEKIDAIKKQITQNLLKF